MARDGGTTQRSFSSGEQSPYLGARADLARWGSSLAVCENFVTILAGGATRRSGTRHVYLAQDNSKFIGFAFSASDGYAVEVAASPGHLRFFRDFGFLDAGGGTPYQISSPYSAAEVAALYPAQSADKVYLACGTQPIMELARVASLDWTLTNSPVKNGPFRTPNIDQTQTLATSATGEYTPGTSLPIAATGCTPFAAGMVGALFRVYVPDSGKYGSWGTETPYSIGDIVMWNSNWYKCVGTFSTKAGPNPPVHTLGKAWDGDIVGSGSFARQWLYLHSGFGIVQITAYTDSSHVTAQAVSYVPSDLGTGTWRWAEGCWSNYRGFPRIVAIHKQRLYALGNAAQPTTVWASVIDDYPNFDDSLPLDTNSFAVDLESQGGTVNIPQWLMSGKRLAIGTAGNPFVITSSDVQSPITPDSVDPNPATTEGSAAVQAVYVDGPIFISADGRRVHLLAYDFTQDDFVAPDLTINADHITGPGVKRLMWLRDPYRLLVALRTDGVIATCSYRKDQNITGWHRQIINGGTPADICGVNSPSGIRQDLWLMVDRVQADSSIVRTIECLQPFFERGTLTSQSAWFVDSGMQYSGAPTATVANIPAHLMGLSVMARGDGKNFGAFTVVDDGLGHMPPTGKITLPKACSLVTVGLGFASKLQTLRYDARLQGKNSRVSRVTVDVINSGQVEAQVNDERTQNLKPEGDAPVDSAQPLYTGTLGTDDPLPNDWSSDGQVTIIANDTGPCTVRAITPQMQVAA